MLLACQGDPINTPPGGAPAKIVSAAINSVGTWQPTPLAVDLATTEAQYDLIQVTLSSSDGPATEDIHVTMVPGPDSLLANYNSEAFDVIDPDGNLVPHPEKYWLGMNTPGAPKFTLLDGGVVTIPKGSNAGYMKIKATSQDYFGARIYAFSYVISSVQESGYTISANNGYSITPLLPKNQWDGVYSLSINTTGWGAYGIADDNKFRDYGNVAYQTTGLTSLSFLNLVRSDNLQAAFTSDESATGFGATNPNFVFDSNNKLVDVFNSVADDGRGRKFAINPAATSKENIYDPATKTITANYLFKQNGRPNMVVKEVLTYVKPR